MSQTSATAQPIGAGAAEPAPPALSVVVPVHDESGAILPLLAEIHAALGGLDHEIVVVDDASRDGTAGELATAGRFLPRLRVLTHRRRYGQSAALLTGVRAARAPWVATLDGDGQNDPRDLLALWRRRGEAPPAEGRAEMLCGIRRERHDRFTKRQASRVANAVRRRALGDGIADTGCGLKLMRRDLYLRLPAFDHMHRFLPALARAQGACVEAVAVSHRPRRAGRSKYGILDRLAAGIVDLAGVWWLNRRRLAPELAAVEGEGDRR